jgi:hypothetical protein
VIAEIDDSGEPIGWRWVNQDLAPPMFIERFNRPNLELIGGTTLDGRIHYTTATPTERLTQDWLRALLDGIWTSDLQVEVC